MRALQRSTKLEKVQRLLGVRPTSLGSLSEATEVFTAEHFLRAILQEVAGRSSAAVSRSRGPPPLWPPKPLCRRWHRSQCPAKNGLGLVDGRPAPSGQNALHFDVLKGVPIGCHFDTRRLFRTWSNCGPCCNRAASTSSISYAGYELYRDILNAKSSFVGRVNDNTAFTVKEEQTPTPEAIAAGVVRDVILAKLGTPKHKDVIGKPVRLVTVRRRKTDGTWEELWLVTDHLDMSADLVALAYRYRWTIELFFRWFKCVLAAGTWCRIRPTAWRSRFMRP